MCADCEVTTLGLYSESALTFAPILDHPLSQKRRGMTGIFRQKHTQRLDEGAISLLMQLSSFFIFAMAHSNMLNVYRASLKTCMHVFGTAVQEKCTKCVISHQGSYRKKAFLSAIVL